MKSLVEHMVEQEDLEERLLRTGAIATYGVRSRKEGDASVRAFSQQHLCLRGLEHTVRQLHLKLTHILIQQN